MVTTGVSGARRWWALIAVAMSMLVVGLDLTVLNLALPTIANDLHASSSDLQWFNDAYSLVLAAVVLPAGLLGDRLGRKKVLMTSLAVFGVSSLACAYAGGSGELIAARAVLGLGAAAIMPLALAIIPVLFAPEERQKATAIMASTIFLSFPIGPLVGGALLDNFWWGSVFLINVPVVVFALIAVAILMPESRSSERPRLDLVGMLISSTGLIALTYGFIKAGQDGWTDMAAMATIAAGAVVLAGLIGWERRLTNAAARPGLVPDTRARVRPLIELPLFRSAGFAWGTILATMISFAMFGILYAMPQYFQAVHGVNALHSGVELLPLIGGMLVGMIGGTRLQSPRKDAAGNAREPVATARSMVAIGYTVMAAGLAVGAFTSTSSSTGFTAAWFAVAGLGLGLAMPAAMNAALGALSAERSGAGSALITAMRQVGATIGVAVLGTILNNVYLSHLTGAALPTALTNVAKNGVEAGVTVAQRVHSTALLTVTRDSFVHGLDVMLWVCGGIALVSAVLAVVFLPRRIRLDGAGQPGTTLPATNETHAQRAELGL
ncbi:MAG TPA: MFS transporter [Streptosporangiaceae bacterium]|nr:MFS transporter [Streptosporangiaceae bacterium]